MLYFTGTMWVESTKEGQQYSQSFCVVMSLSMELIINPCLGCEKTITLGIDK